MDLRILIEPQLGASYEQQLALTLAAERLGYSAVMRSDHYLTTETIDPLPGPSDAWVTLGALARDTTSVRLGTLMTSAQFRPPAPLAMAVAQVDNMSDGRIEFGLGAGWFDREHEAFGLAFPAIAERFDRLEEQLEIITGLWRSGPDRRFSYRGAHYQVTDCPGLPVPVQPGGPPIIIGGYGKRRTPLLAARFAAEFNVGLVSAGVVGEQFGRVRAACEQVGRDPNAIVYSTATTVSCAESAQEAQRKVAQLGLGLEEFAALGIIGTPEEVAEHLAALRAAGAERCYLRVVDINDIAQLELIAETVMPQLPV